MGRRSACSADVSGASSLGRPESFAKLPVRDV
jgi:hypothetical protein